jgi:hypothetical protein
MGTWNHAASALFDVLLAPFGYGPAWFLLWPLLAGVFALVVYKRLSNQKGIERAKCLTHLTVRVRASPGSPHTGLTAALPPPQLARVSLAQVIT